MQGRKRSTQVRVVWSEPQTLFCPGAPGHTVPSVCRNQHVSELRSAPPHCSSGTQVLSEILPNFQIQNCKPLLLTAPFLFIFFSAFMSPWPPSVYHCVYWELKWCLGDMNINSSSINQWMRSRSWLGDKGRGSLRCRWLLLTGSEGNGTRPLSCLVLEGRQWHCRATRGEEQVRQCSTKCVAQRWGTVRRAPSQSQTSWVHVPGPPLRALYGPRGKLFYSSAISVPL